MFNVFKTAVQRQFNAIKGQQLFMVDIDGNTLWDAYLSAFPEGTDPIYKERTEHDCCACRSFIKSAGTLVAISDANTSNHWLRKKSCFRCKRRMNF